ncbi:MAG TPA: RNA polymerase-associated protein RapA, partial [Pseudohongiella sp.]|nr:RNA polymerase-associated protein RapA [Pseudohongiella sp.]
MPDARIFSLGQRWNSDTEPELGLGIVTDLDHRTVTVAFPSCQQTRRYAQAQAPLTRLRLASGDPVSLPGSGDEPPLDAVIEARHEGSNHTFVYMVRVNDEPPQPLPEQA